MTTFSVLPNIATVIAERSLPTVTLWNRVEGRPRAERFDRALRAEVRDALWMLTRQWQMAEFQGDDAASPVFAKLQISESPLLKYRPDTHEVEPFDDTVPLEANVERRPLPLTHGRREVSLDIRLLAGRQWLKMLAPPADVRAAFIAKYAIHAPDPDDPADAIYCAHPEAWSSFAAVAGRAMDGVKLLDYLEDPAHHAADGIAGLDVAATDAVAADFVAWFRSLFYQPAKNDAWLPERMEYQFACSAPEGGAEKVLLAEEYFHGHLDWYNLDVDPTARFLGDAAAPAPPAPKPQTVIPTSITFDGMPNTRWWTFEDSRTNFGGIRPDTTDLAKLMLAEFGLTFANDWFLLPYTVKAGTVVRIRGMAVTDVFGDRTWVEAAGRGPDDAWQRWAMFLLNTRGQNNEPADTSLLLLPTAAAVQEGKPLDEVMLVRDEVANMVWGVEKTIPLPTGEGKAGFEAARETRAFFERRAAALPEPLPPAAPIRYDAMSTVAENWIPFIPVHVPGSIRDTQLQRAALLRIIERQLETKVHPRTTLLREGLDALPDALPYFLHEEEVPRAGVVVRQTFQRTRWRDGRAWVWVGVRKQSGRGGASSGLAFDRLVDAEVD
ncbi:MAG TPA: hypothetical protein VGR02_13975 [Thermoanaerobaculia bacterium]|jgi:hypothetical protein|nr:hypothetical protein [Thermoanaerobaculia bacterium]